MQATASESASATAGQLARTARDRRGISQEKLAREADVSLSMIKRLELQDQLPNTRALARIAGALGVQVTDLLPAELTA